MHYICRGFSLNPDFRSAKGALGRDHCVVEARKEDWFTFSQEVDKTTEFQYPPGIRQMVAIFSNNITGTYQ